MLENKVVIVTGGTSGIGRSAAIALAKAGAKVVVTGRREKEGEETVQLIKKAGKEGLFIKTDINNESDVANMVKKTLNAFGKLDVAFNNAGIGGGEKLIPEATVEDYESIFNTNVKGVLLSMKYEIPAMLKSGGGSIINNASVAGMVGIAGSAIYCASKSAVISLTKSAALEFAKKNIRINSIAPAAIETEMSRNYIDALGEEKAKAFIGMHPIGRIGTPDEIADVVVFLASNYSSFITGQNIPVDGGFTVP